MAYSYPRYRNTINREPQQTSIMWDEASQSYKCIFAINFNNPRHKDFLNIIKMMIPANERIYDPVIKNQVAVEHPWFIHEKWYDIVLGLAQGAFGEVFTFKKPEGFEFSTAQYNPAEDYNVFKTILAEAGIISANGNGDAQLKSAPLSDVTKLYRKAAMMLHPDRNPNNATKMSQLNEVWARLKGTYFK